MRHLVYNFRHSVVTINSSLLTITLYSSVITTLIYVQSLSWRYRRVRLYFHFFFVFNSCHGWVSQSAGLSPPEARIPPQISPCVVCVGQNGTGTGFPSSKYRDVPLSVSFRQCSILILTYLLLLPEEQTAETSEPSKREVLSEFGKHWIEDCLHFSRH